MNDTDAQRLATAEQILAGIPEYDWLIKSDTKFWSTGEVAQKLNVSSNTVRQWCIDGLIPHAIEYGRQLGWRMPRSGLILYFAGLLQKRQGS